MGFVSVSILMESEDTMIYVIDRIQKETVGTWQNDQKPLAVLLLTFGDQIDKGRYYLLEKGE